MRIQRRHHRDHCPDEYTVVMTTDAPKANMLMNTHPSSPSTFGKDWRILIITEMTAHRHLEPFKFDSEGEGFIKLTRIGLFPGDPGR
jgi:hypothetical protein